jgi:hypothetical protein
MMTTNRKDMSGWQRQFGSERYVGGRRPDSPQERERQRLAHEQEMESHPPSGLDWLTALQGKNPEKAKRLQQTTPSETPLRQLIR